MQLDLYSGLGAAALLTGVPLLLILVPLLLSRLEVWMFRSDGATAATPAPVAEREPGVVDVDHSQEVADAVAHLLADADTPARRS